MLSIATLAAIRTMISRAYDGSPLDVEVTDCPWEKRHDSKQPNAIPVQQINETANVSMGSPSTMAPMTGSRLGSTCIPRL
jgi:hypothetical protein